MSISSFTIINGRAGFGKTHYCLNEVLKTLETDKTVRIWIINQSQEAARIFLQELTRNMEILKNRETRCSPKDIYPILTTMTPFA